MRRADRLYQITLFLRSRPLTTARWLAQQLGVSERTIYRDVSDLLGTGLPIDGEAGVGYRLKQNLDLPPLSFTREELDALRLGARMVQGYGDADLASAARSAQAKIEVTLRRQIDLPTRLYAPIPQLHATLRPLLGRLRQAVHALNVVHIAYTRADGTPSERELHPLGLFFWHGNWTLAAWCELRGDYRHFRLDRIRACQVLPQRFPQVAGRNLHDMLRRMGVDPALVD
ncbi:helix-turn-helix transcriptional regulator [Chitiniphilus eburneus]|uniref:YafY family transcriptional regulator n=1 Tax=Chitiniphilus eburneus TaxID=2571148 RepID=A0A4U0QC35_9NEIS|nr:YafY family protein [Chitiniphilus eburneus]TJZ78963.1 YafY family transcriptional regulator [Chitiniphilus eburneus]